ncbi:MAG: hypothetical protein P9X27_00850 [Candidatus Kaelpia aquatica]|nr:hypothetical protein [Candidatus Kaelpia aquatica]
MIKTKIKTIGYLLCIVSLLFIASRDSWGEDKLKKTLPSVITLKIETKDSRTFNAMAFMAIENGVAVTSWQVVSNAKRVVARFPNGEEFESQGLIDKDLKRNLALIKVKIFGRPLLSCDPAEPAAGSKAYFWDMKDPNLNISETTIDRVEVAKGIKIYYLSSLLSRENTGGPLLNAKGKVIGVLGLIAGQDDQKLSIGLPSAYVLGLDPALPVQVWQTLKSEASSSAQQNDVIDKQLAEALIQIHDHYTIITWLGNYTHGQGYQRGIPQLIYKNMEELKMELSNTSTLRSADPLRARLLQNTTRALRAYLQATEFFIKAVVVARGSSQGWGAQSKDLFSRADALMSNFPDGYGNFVADVKQLLESSDQFKSSSLIELQYWLGVIELPAGFSFGIQNFARNPFHLFLVRSSSLAENIGFQSGDTIISLGDREFKLTESIEDFKVLLKSYVGQNVEATIKRYDKIQTITLKVPKTL